MLESVTREEFLNGLGGSGVIPDVEFQGFFAGLPPELDGEALACRLVDSGHLTPFQSEALLGGKAGTLRVGNYLVLDRIGAGGMGTVYKARHARRLRRSDGPAT